MKKPCSVRTRCSLDGDVPRTEKREGALSMYKMAVWKMASLSQDSYGCEQGASEQ